MVMKPFKVQNYKINIEIVEKLQDIQAKTGTSMNQIVNEMLKLGIEAAAEIEIDNYIEKEECGKVYTGKCIQDKFQKQT